MVAPPGGWAPRSRRGSRAGAEPLCHQCRRQDGICAMRPTHRRAFAWRRAAKVAGCRSSKGTRRARSPRSFGWRGTPVWAEKPESRSHSRTRILLRDQTLGPQKRRREGGAKSLQGRRQGRVPQSTGPFASTRRAGARKSPCGFVCCSVAGSLVEAMASAGKAPAAPSDDGAGYDGFLLTKVWDGVGARALARGVPVVAVMAEGPPGYADKVAGVLKKEKSPRRRDSSARAERYD